MKPKKTNHIINGERYTGFLLAFDRYGETAKFLNSLSDKKFYIFYKKLKKYFYEQSKNSKNRPL